MWNRLDLIQNLFQNGVLSLEQIWAKYAYVPKSVPHVKTWSIRGTMPLIWVVVRSTYGSTCDYNILLDIVTVSSNKVMSNDCWNDKQIYYVLESQVSSVARVNSFTIVRSFVRSRLEI